MLLPIILIAFVAGCSQVVIGSVNSNSDGTGAKVAEITKIGAILDNPADFTGKTVMIEGKITQECGAGCWFNLADESGIIYVDIAPNNLSIPQKIGSKARVTGTVTISSQNSTYLVGSKVQF